MPLIERRTDQARSASGPTGIRPRSFHSASLLGVGLVGLLWGVNWPVVKFMLREMQPLTIRAIAFPAAALLLAVIARSRGQSLRPAPRDRIAIVVTGLLLVFGFNVLATFGQLLTETSKAAIIAYTMPALTAVFAAVFLRERLGALGVLALCLGMTGLLVLASEDFAVLVADPRGPAIMLTAAAAWALGNVMLKARRWSIAPLPLTVWFFATASVFCWPLVFIFEPPWQHSWPSTPVLWALGYHVLGPMVVCYTLWTIMVERLPATVAAISVLTAPVFGVLSASLWLGDPLSWQKILALAMVLTSIALTLRRQ